MNGFRKTYGATNHRTRQNIFSPGGKNPHYSNYHLTRNPLPDHRKTIRARHQMEGLLDSEG
jgi:hypothetical protein